MTTDGTHQQPLSTSRRQAITGGAAMGAACLATGAVHVDAAANADFLFLQTAPSMAYAADRYRLTLHNVSLVTLFFSDRPEHIAGNTV